MRRADTLEAALAEQAEKERERVGAIERDLAGIKVLLDEERARYAALEGDAESRIYAVKMEAESRVAAAKRDAETAIADAERALGKESDSVSPFTAAKEAWEVERVRLVERAGRAEGKLGLLEGGRADGVKATEEILNGCKVALASMAVLIDGNPRP
jgi:vacuolar-type H+-ATPase subunit H